MTGAATGIGAATASKLKAAGHEITAFDITDPGDGVDTWIRVDMNDPEAIEAALAQAKGPYDALINNAGLPPREGEAERVLNVNLIGLRHFMQGMVPHMAKGGSIVSTASRAGAFWRDNLKQVKALLALKSADELAGFIKAEGIDATRAYHLSKEAVIVMTMQQTEAMLARGLRINSVSPAAVSTGILDDFVRAFGARVAANIERVGRAGTAEEVADVIVFLAGPESGWIKGQDIVIDGGMSAMAMADSLI